MQQPSNEADELSDIAQRFPEIDESDVAEIVRLAGPVVVAMLRSRGWHKTVNLEDVFVDAVFRLWRYRNGYDASRASLTAYLYAIARNIASERYRQSRETAQPLTLLDFDQYLATPHEQELAADSPMVKELRDVLSHWRSIDRDILFAWVQGDTHWASQFAKQSKFDANWVRVRKSRLVQKMRTEMAARGYCITETES